MRNPDYLFTSLDAGEIVAEMIARYEELTGEAVQPASPEKLFIQWVAAVIVQERALSNWIGNQNVPSRAEGENLDALGELFYNTPRPAATAATCTVRFHISEAQSAAVLIPAGTRVTDGSQTLYWETEEDAYVPIGDTYADLRVKCQTTGEIGNGYAEGQINTVVDVYDYYSGCENTEVSTGGADEATDDEYYQLLRLSLDAYSCAGPRNAYIYYAKKADASVADVKAIRPGAPRAVTLPLYTLSGAKYAFLGGDELILDTLTVYPHGSSTAAEIETDYTASIEDGLLTISVTSGGALASETQIDVNIQKPSAGRVTIYAITENADGTTGAAGEGVKSKILDACNADEVRPLTDLVTVADPAPVSYGIDFTYYLQRGGTESAADVEDAVDAAVEQYKVWQGAKLGRDINPSRLLGMLMQIPGIKRVELTAPSFAVLKDGSDGSVPEYAVCTGGGGTSGGDEDE